MGIPQQPKTLMLSHTRLNEPGLVQPLEELGVTPFSAPLHGFMLIHISNTPPAVQITLIEICWTVGGGVPRLGQLPKFPEPFQLVVPSEA
jgi:hypothetical protein